MVGPTGMMDLEGSGSSPGQLRRGQEEVRELMEQVAQLMEEVRELNKAAMHY